MGTPGTARPPAIVVSMRPAGFRVPSNRTGRPAIWRSHVTVTNDGHQPVMITPETITLAATHTCAGAKPPTWLTLASTRPLILGPGASHSIAFTVTALPGANGGAAVIAAAQPVHVTGHFRASGAVGARVLLGNGKVTCTAPRAIPATHSAGAAAGSAPIGLILLVSCLGAALLAGLVIAARRLRRS